MHRTVRVGSEVGLHARPAAAFVAAAGEVTGGVRVGRDPASLVDATSILSVLGLGARHGDELVLEADDEAGLDRLAALVEASD